jgi:hypothetical protein
MATNNKKIELDIDAKINAASATDDLRKLTRLLKDLNSELSAIDETSADFNRLKDSIGEVEGKIGDASDRLRTITGEPLERVNAGLGLVGEGLKNLDFTKVSIGIDGLADGITKFSSANFSESIGKAKTSLGNLGKALMSSKLLLAGLGVGAAVLALSALSDKGGLAGKMFKSLTGILTGVKDGFLQMTDSIGLTDTKTKILSDSFLRLTADVNSTNDAMEQIATAGGMAHYNLMVEKLNNNIGVAQGDLEAYIKSLGLEQIQIENLNYEFDRYLEIKKQMGLPGSDLKKLASDLLQIEKAIKSIVGDDKESEALIAKKIKLNDALIKKNTTVAEEANKAAVQSYDIQTQLDEAFDNLITDSTQREIAQVKTKYKKIREFDLSNLQEKLKDQKRIAEESINTVTTQIETTRLEYTTRLSLGQDAAANESKLKLEGLQEDKKINEDNLKSANQQLEDSKKLATTYATLEQREIDKIIWKSQADRAKIELEKTREAQAVLTDESKLQSGKKMELYDAEEKKILTYYSNLLKLADNANERGQIDLDLKKDLDALDIKRYNTLVNYNKKREEGDNKDEENKLKQIKYEQDLLDARINTAQNLIDINNVRIQELNSTANQYKNVLEDETDALIENYGNQLFLLEAQKQKELKLNEDNTINRKEKELEIEAKYNALIKKSGLDTAEAITAAKIKEIDRQMSYFKAGLEGATLLADIAQNIDDQRRKDGEEQSFKAASKEFVIRQGLAAAGVIMSTSESVMKSVAASPLTGGMPWTAINIGMGALQLAKILTTKFNFNGGGGSVAGAGGGSTNVTAPDMAQTPKNPFFSQGYMNQNIGPNGMVGFRPGKDNSMIKVGVYESDIRNVMNKVNVLETRSTLSGAGN